MSGQYRRNACKAWKRQCATSIDAELAAAGAGKGSRRGGRGRSRQRRDAVAGGLWRVEVAAGGGLECPEQAPPLLPRVHALQLAAPVGQHLCAGGGGWWRGEVGVGVGRGEARVGTTGGTGGTGTGEVAKRRMMLGQRHPITKRTSS